MIRQTTIDLRDVRAGDVIVALDRRPLPRPREVAAPMQPATRHLSAHVPLIHPRPESGVVWNLYADHADTVTVRRRVNLAPLRPITLRGGTPNR